MEKTIAKKLARFNGELNFDGIPGRVLGNLILDTLSICLASSRMDFGRAALSIQDLVRTSHYP
jgi:hypothetical protein